MHLVIADMGGAEAEAKEEAICLKEAKGLAGFVEESEEAVVWEEDEADTHSLHRCGMFLTQTHK